jgi:hypothetical protein
MLGSVVIDEVVLPITGLRLTGGKLQITAYAGGPLPRIRVARYVVHGDDGVVVYRSSRDDTTTVGPLGPKDSVSVTLDVEVTGRVSQPDGPARVYEDRR